MSITTSFSSGSRRLKLNGAKCEEADCAAYPRVFKVMCFLKVKADCQATCKSLIEVGGILLQDLLQVLFLVAEGQIQPGPCCRESLGAVTVLVAGKRNESALQRLIIEGISVGSACHWLSPRRWFGLFGRKPH